MQHQAEFQALRQTLAATIIGQPALLDRLLIGLLTGGHILLEGPPGLAKTKSVHALAAGIHGRFARLQFTPDLMPGDLTGSDVFDPEAKAFRFIEGPLFHEIVLADEINRAPPKVQSALLEAMAEHQVTVGGVTRPLPELFLVMATQNPLEQSGTYPLPEAQLDRFLLHVMLGYPSPDDELRILQLDRRSHFSDQAADALADDAGPSPLQPDTVLAARREVAGIHIEEVLERYVVAIVTATRDLGAWHDEWSDLLVAGASPRASIALLRSASALAYLQGRDYLTPEDIMDMAPDVLRHRLLLDHGARIAGISADDIVAHLLTNIPVP